MCRVQQNSCHTQSDRGMLMKELGNYEKMYGCSYVGSNHAFAYYLQRKKT